MTAQGPRIRDLGYVFAGGAVGATGRVALATWSPVEPGAYPWTTFAENVIGAFLLALVFAILIRRAVADRRFQLLVGTGVLGAFTTYSTFAVEIDQLLRVGAARIAVTYAVASVLTGVVAALGGLTIGFRVIGRHGGTEPVP